MSIVSYLKENEFELVMTYIGMKKDIHLIQKLFWLFDADADMVVTKEEMELGLSYFREHSLDDKIQSISGFISIF